MLGWPKPSLTSPVINIDEATISEISFDEEDSIAATIIFSGFVSGQRYDHEPKDDFCPSVLRVYVNDSDEPLAKAPLTVERGASQGREAPFPFRGNFRFKLRGVALCEGVNTVEIRTNDPFCKLDGCAKFAAEISVVWDESAGDLDRSQPPQIDKNLDLFRVGGHGECHLYTIAIAGAPYPLPDLLVQPLGLGKDAPAFSTTFDPLSGWHYLSYPDSDLPLMLSMHLPAAARVSRYTFARPHKISAARPDLAGQSPDVLFRFGFGLGQNSLNLETVISGLGLFADVLQPDSTRGWTTLPLRLVDKSLGRKGLTTLIGGPAVVNADTFGEATFDLCEFALYVTKLFAMKHEMSHDFVIAMLVEDWKDIGLEGYEMHDGRSIFGHYGAEILEALFEDAQTTSDPFLHGLNAGQAITQIINHIVRWRRKNGVSGYFSKADFLETLGK